MLSERELDPNEVMLKSTKRRVIFLQRIDVRGADECWPWLASKTKRGYGQVKWDGKTQPATRVLWTLLFGEIPEGLHVLHSCDNPPCMNPSHLWLGTPGHNALDRDLKGRGYRQREWLVGADIHALRQHLEKRLLAR